MELKNIVHANSATVIDVRSRAEFMFGHVPSSVNIPLDSLMSQLDRIKAMEGPLILVCASGNRSGIAVELLRRAGIDTAVNGGGYIEIKRLLKKKAA